MIIGLFNRESGHPLEDAREVRRVIAELPTEQSVKAVDEIAGWFESLASAVDFRGDRLYDVVNLLDQAAQAHVRKLTRDYLAAVRAGHSDERAIWAHGRFYWEQLAGLYERIIEAAGQKDKVGEYLKPNLPVISCRLLSAYVAQIKWGHFRHEQPSRSLWERIGHVYLDADQAKYATKVVALYSALSGNASVEQEFLRAAILGSSSLEALQPVETELVDRLVTHLLAEFVIARGNVPGMLYWIDAATGEPPSRLARLPQPSPSVRLIAPGNAPAVVAELSHAAERGSLPPELNLGAEYPARLVLRALRHLATYLSPAPPMRQHKRHPVKTRLSVVSGLIATMETLGGVLPAEADDWWSENVSLGGFGAVIEKAALDSKVGVGTLVCVRADGGNSWVVGLVRRYARVDGGATQVGIQALTRQARIGEFVPRASGTYMAAGSFSGVVIADQEIGDEIRVLLPPTRFDLRENLDLRLGEQRFLLLPAECIESSVDFDFARYRVRPVA